MTKLNDPSQDVIDDQFRPISPILFTAAAIALSATVAAGAYHLSSFLFQMI